MTELLLVVVPGVVAVEVFRAAYPGTRTGWVPYVGWVVVWGVLVSAAVLWLDDNVLSATLGARQARFGVELVAALVAGGALAALLRIVVRVLRFAVARSSPALQWLRPDRPSVWVSANQPYVNDDWAVVYLHDGAIYLGWIAQFSNDPRRESQQFVLQDARRLDDDLSERYMVAGAGVFMDTRDVARVEYWTGGMEDS